MFKVLHVVVYIPQRLILIMSGKHYLSYKCQLEIFIYALEYANNFESHNSCKKSLGKGPSLDWSVKT